MNLIIHRGTRQIGGSCVEVQAGADRILLDLGSPLPTGKDDKPIADQTKDELFASGILLRINGVYADSTPDARAVVMSHVHPDHIGLGPYVHPDIPIYATKGTWALHDVTQIFGYKPQAIVNRHALPKRRPVQFGALSVTAIPVDHSAPDAVALLIEGGGKRVLYSGDLRAHGRKSYLWRQLKSSDLAGRLDALLLEGTTIGRQENRIVTEQSLEDQLVKELEHQNSLSLIFCSPQNVDRLVTIYRAAKRLNRIMVIDLYAAYVLHALRDLSPNLPQWNWPKIRVIQWRYQQDRLIAAGRERFIAMTGGKRIGWKEIKAGQRNLLFLARSNSSLKRLEENVFQDTASAKVFWSQWIGYWDTDEHARRLCERRGWELSTLHTSGHASWSDLKELAGALRPKTIIPIHTAHAARFADELPNTLLASDGQTLAI